MYYQQIKLRYMWHPSPTRDKIKKKNNKYSNSLYLVFNRSPLEVFILQMLFRHIILVNNRRKNMNIHKWQVYARPHCIMKHLKVNNPKYYFFCIAHKKNIFVYLHCTLIKLLLSVFSLWYSIQVTLF